MTTSYRSNGHDRRNQNGRANGHAYLPGLNLPALARPLRVLCLGAHSDDIEIGCGGTLAQLARKKPQPEFRWVVLSAAGHRAREAQNGARKFLGAASKGAVLLHEFRDGYFPAQFDAIKDAFESLAREFQPDVVFTHTRADRHQDHRVVSDLTWNTFRKHLILEYEIPKWDGDLGQPNVYVPLPGSVARRKSKALLDVFGTQRAKDWFSEETFLGLLRLRGIECRAEDGYAEAFHARKLLFPV
ncbi:MAG TPA: PIG-L deacetylase family protein [Gemmatimonadaceae bacterium]|nr:PIG-L deacetylase family protein [Gemmatimonadaceae bacterium]